MKPSQSSSKRSRNAERDGGFVIAMFALTLTGLLVFAGFSVDVGAWYARASQIQRAADAAALAGVVWMPDFEEASKYALEAAARNGFVPGGDITVTPERISGNDRQLRVVITDSRVDQYFSSLVMDPSSITRRSVAEYVMPVPLGSPDWRFGNDPLASPPHNPQVWASINAPGAIHGNGDPYATKCLPSSASTCTASMTTAQNPNYRKDGYLWAVDVPAAAVGRDLTVEVYDAGFYGRSDYPFVETADNGSGNVEFELFRGDNTPLDTADNLLPGNSAAGSCSSGPGRFRIANGASEPTYKNRWALLCTINVQAGQTGQWFLRVKSSDITGFTDSGTGWNQFSLRSSLSGSGLAPRIYAVGDLSVFNNLPAFTGSTASATFYMAEIAQIHAGKSLRISLFDPGDGSGDGVYDLRLLGPGLTGQPCTYTVRGSGISQNSPTCTIRTRTDNGRGGYSNIYNNKWLDIAVQLPTSYTCSTDCWWRVRYDFTGLEDDRSSSRRSSPSDRTVWSAQIIGDPVHLVE